MPPAEPRKLLGLGYARVLQATLKRNEVVEKKYKKGPATPKREITLSLEPSLFSLYGLTHI